MYYFLEQYDALLGALALSFIPIFIWLAFWLTEDWRHPEPRQRLMFAFLAGMVMVYPAIKLQEYALALNGGSQAGLLPVWALTEEALKLVAASATVLWFRYADEPIDMPIYMITVALGFAAVENALFILHPLIANTIIDAAQLGGVRFIGATLIHVVCSALIGTLLAYTFYKSYFSKILACGIGVILAGVLHAFFNFLILNVGVERGMTALLAIWMSTIFILVMLEKIKFLHRPAWWESLSPKQLKL